MQPLHRFAVVVLVAVSGLLSACGTSPDASAPLFTDLPSDSTGVTFSNAITEDDSVNVLAYEYLYNGGGVAIGDVNGDDRPDLFFTGNMTADRLYLNDGGFRFRDVTEAANVAGLDGWTTGVTMADVNGDGRLDIYVCRSGWMEDADRRRNLLYINQGADAGGTPRFTEQAAAYGLNDASNSTHATFFDYDRDGDLDLYLLNHPTKRFIGRFELDTAREQKDPFAGDKLFRNDTGSESGPGAGLFTDVSDEAGIIGNAIGYGLSATVSDLNGDGWPDLYVANDYIEDDYLYINQGNGTFSEEIRARLDHTSYSSMGADIADVNNDGRLDIYTLDMLAEDNYRQKILKGPQDYRFYRNMLSRGYHYQFMRNMLHLGRTDTVYSEIGQLAGVSNTDWSWAALLADFDLDGYNDLYVTNGYRRDYTNLDFLNNVLFGNLDFIKYLETDDPRYADLYGLTQQMPSTPIPNYAFRNAGDLTFDDVSAAWGLGERGFSNGAAYGDLDGDGDLDLVVSNINAPASVYRNAAAQRTDHRYLRIRLAGEGGNRHGIGAQVRVRTPGGATYYREMQPARGFQSSMDPALTIGLGAAEAADVTVRWPSGQAETRRGVPANQSITLRQADASPADAQLPGEENASGASPLLVDQTPQRGLTFTHQENLFVDFDREPLMPRMLSRLGPALAVGDADGDGREDVFIGGARGQRAALFLQQPGGTFDRTTVPVLSAHRGYEDVAATFFDANGDGALDLYVVSGGADSMEPSFYQDRLYVNDGVGGFQAAPSGSLPAITSSGGAVAPHDYDGDGDLDLFIGGRVVPGAYPEAPRSYLLENDGAGRFTDVTASVSEGLPDGGLERPGMVTAAAWADLTGDGAAELIIAGEWMPVRAFAVEGEAFTEVSGALGLRATGGWWEALLATDIDEDGDVDLVAGNWGENGQIEASPNAPARVYAADVDGDGTVDPLMSHVLDGTEYPIYWRDALVEQIPPLDDAFGTYESFARASMEDILDALDADGAPALEAHMFASSVFVNTGGRLERAALPVEAQMAPVRGWAQVDLDGDGRSELLGAGNDYTVRTQWGRQDAGKGVVLHRANTEGGAVWTTMPVDETGVWAAGDVRRIATVETPRGPIIVVARNNGAVTAWRVRESSPSDVATARRMR